MAKNDRLVDCNAGNGSRKKQQLFPTAVLCGKVRKFRRESNEMPRRLKDKTAKWQGDCKGMVGRMGKSESEKSGRVRAFML